MDDKKLLESVKQYLAITWSEEDSNIINLINEGKDYLKDTIGSYIDFNDNSVISLLKDYCRYVRNYSKEYFETNFLKDIIKLQIKYANSKIETSHV